MHYGLLAESGILEKKSGEGGYFIISVVIVANPAEVKDVMKIARRKARGKLRIGSTFHAYKEGRGVIKLVLDELVKRNIEIIVGVWDKRKTKSQIDKNQVYRQLVAQTVKLTIGFYPKLDLTIHKRYTNPQLQKQLQDAIVQAIKYRRSDTVIFISQLEESQRRELELADAVAYAVFQKYNRGESELYQIIQKKIKKESRLAA